MFFAVMLGICTAGCAESSADDTIEAQTEMNIIAPPADGWTHEQLSEVTYLCGMPFSLPCTVESLEKSGFTAASSEDLDSTFEEYTGKSTDLFPSDSEIYDVDLEYSGLRDRFVGWYCINDEGERIIWKIAARATSYDDDYSETDPVMTFNGITPNDDFPTVTQALGKNYYQIDKSKTHIYDIQSNLYEDETIQIVTFDEELILWIEYSLY